MSDARILVYDIETSQNIAKTWGPKYNTNLNSITDLSHLLSFGYRWLGDDTEPDVVSLRQFKRSYKRNRRDDRQLVQALVSLFDEADMVVAHNGDKFDEKVLQGRMAVHGMNRLAPTASVDTLKVARSEFRFPSYHLNDLARYFDLKNRKVQHSGLYLWDEVDEGDEAAWDTMEEYNQQDVVLEDELYLFLRDGGWIRRHPNLALIKATPDACPYCGAEHTLQVRGYYDALTQTYPKLRCSKEKGGCGGYSRGITAINRDETHGRPKPNTRPI